MAPYAATETSYLVFRLLCIQNSRIMTTPFSFRFLIVAFAILLVPSCGLENMVLEQTGGASAKPTQTETATALKEALTKGIGQAAIDLSKLDGYFGNPKIRIPFPPEAEKISNTLRDIGLGKLVDDVELSVNRAAEDAAAKAKPIFVDAIRAMTIQDAMGILFGGEHAATNYLQAKTTASLTSAFKPVIQGSLDKVNATKYWTDAITAYNKIPLVKKQNPDLVDYVNAKALDGLFFQVGEEEARIRQNPVERTTALLKKVFGYYDQNK